MWRCRATRALHLASANELVYTSPYVADGPLGVAVVVPLVDPRAKSDLFLPPFPPEKMLSANGAGVGDIVFGPFIQFNPIIGPNGAPVFAQRIGDSTGAETWREQSVAHARALNHPFHHSTILSRRFVQEMKENQRGYRTT
jgi:hypothetical protein